MASGAAALPPSAAGAGGSARTAGGQPRAGGDPAYEPTRSRAGTYEPLPFHRSSDAPLTAQVTIGRGSRRIPGSFFGLAIEYNELGRYEAEGPLFDRFISLVQPQDGSRLILRLGGRSGDAAYWNTDVPHAPSGVIQLGDAWMSRLAELVARDRLHVVLGLNVAVHSPTMAADFAKAALDALPRSSLVGLEIGNEPDLYSIQPYLEKQRLPTTVPGTPQHWTHNYSPADYRRDYLAYARALTAKTPGIPLVAPEVGSPLLDWIKPLGRLGRLSPGIITFHRYASSTCVPPLNGFYPSLLSFLGTFGTTGLANGAEPIVQFGRRHHVPVRVSELNSVSCGGVKGVTDTFATSLWATDALFEFLHHGIAGVNWETRPTTANAPFHPIGDRIEPEPELYGLATFAQMIGPHARLLNIRLTGLANPMTLKVWAVRSRTGLKILLLNKDSQGAATTLLLHGVPPQASVRWLWAPASNSRRHITLAGQWIGSDARWHGHLREGTLSSHHGAFKLLVPGYSAALLTFPAS